MKCERYQRWISDDIDGALPDLKKERLESHLRACPACRAFRKDLGRIQVESGREGAEPITADYFEAFTAAIGKKLQREKNDFGRGGFLPLRWRWAWVSVPLALAFILGLVFFHDGGDAVRPEILSFEGCLDQVFQEIGGDDEIAADFSRFLSGSLLEEGGAVVLEDNVDFWNDPFFWRSLSDEALKLIEDEIKREIRS